jgi:hypothetical protein
MMMLIGDKNDVKYNSGLENETKNQPSKAVIAKALQDLKEEMKEEEVTTDEDIEDIPMQEPVVEEEEEPKGLMARRG